MIRPAVRLGLRENAPQFTLLVGLNALVGAMIGLERSILPVIGEQDFGLRSKTAILSFIVAFGIAKAFANLAAGGLAERAGRKHLLVLGWLLALPVPILIAVAPSWGVVVIANLFLGASQGLAWSMTVVMKIDLVGPRRRGLALGLNESAGYLGVALTAFATGALAASFAPRTLVWIGGLAIALAGTVLSLVFVADTSAHVDLEESEAASQGAPGNLRSALLRGSLQDPELRAYSQAGLVNNLNDALAWGLVPLYLAANGASAGEIGVVAAVYPAVWGVGQLGAGWLSDHSGRKPLITLGMLLQGGALVLLAAGGGAFAPALAAAISLGIGTALVYPTLIAAVSDVVSPRGRAPAVGVYRFWRDAGFVAGAVVAGLVADAFGSATAIYVVAGVTAASGVWVGAAGRGRAAALRPRRTIHELLEESRGRIIRLEPREALNAAERGALLIDIRSDSEREVSGAVPGSFHIPRSVLEWRVDPASEHKNPRVADLDRELILFCSEGYCSSLAAAVLRDLGFARVGDIVGGFVGWEAAGLPVRRPPTSQRRTGELAGMGPAEPLDAGNGTG